ncbi:MAG: molybdopterin-dependent oxidoreductase, partial [Akkermansiaceae bacterium]|nr:molybdopterin-dependent oxidoreductase [Armatimonadota bacterium]
MSEVDQQWETARGEFFAFVGSGLVVVFAFDQVPASHESGGGRRGGPGVSSPQEIGVWLHVGEDGLVTGYTGKVEFGQGIRTSLSRVIADELPVLLASIRMVMGDTDLSPFDGGTAGSRTSPIIAPQIRKVAAAMREILLDLATQQAQLQRDSLFMTNGKVVQRGTTREFSIAELARGQKRFQAVGDEVVTKPATQWGGGDMPDPRANGRALVTGGHRYTSDIKRPGMLHGKVLRSPSVNARRLLLDTGAAETMPGATVVRDGDFVGAVAGDILTATRAVEAMRVEWEAAVGQPSTHEVFDHLRKSSRDMHLAGGDITSHTEGSVAEGMAAADRTIDSTYTVAYIAHAPLEPRAAGAEWNDGRLTVWT